MASSSSARSASHGDSAGFAIEVSQDIVGQRGIEVVGNSNARALAVASLRGLGTKWKDPDSGRVLGERHDRAVAQVLFVRSNDVHDERASGGWQQIL